MRSVAEAAWSPAQDRAPLGAERGREPLPGVCGSLGKFAQVPLHESESPWLTGWQLGWNRTAHVGTLAAGVRQLGRLSEPWLPRLQNGAMQQQP